MIDGMDMSDVVRTLSLPSGSVVIQRAQGAGEWVNGRFEEPARVSTPLTFCVVHPVDGDELQSLPEAARTRETLQFFSIDEVKPIKRSSAQLSDLLAYNGEQYQPITDANWNDQSGYWDVIASRVRQ